MKPIEFKEQNIILGKDQPEYITQPAHKTTDGIVTSCWQLNLKERIKILFTGKIWWSTLTFNKPLQPQKPDLNNPIQKYYE